MTVTKCDFCKKNITDKPVIAGWGYSKRFELCNKCGSPVLAFLKKHKLPEDPFDKLRSVLKKENFARLTR